MRVRGSCLVLVAAAVLAACTSSPAPTPNHRRLASRDLLAVTTGSGVMVLDAQTGAPLLDAPEATPMPDWSEVVTGATSGGFTVVRLVDVRGETATSTVRVRGDFDVGAVSGFGTTVALSPAPAAVGSRFTPTPRARTPLVVADLVGGGSSGSISAATSSPRRSPPTVRACT